MTRSTLEWLGVLIFAALAGAFLSFAVKISVICKPGDAGVSIGHAMLLYGCQR
jgi:hypothetical protein